MQEQQQAMHAGLKEIWAALQKALTQKQKQQQQKQQQQQQQPVQQSSSSTSPYVAEKPYSWLSPTKAHLSRLLLSLSTVLFIISMIISISFPLAFRQLSASLGGRRRSAASF